VVEKVIRPVKVQPWQQDFQWTKPDGKLTPQANRLLFQMWQRMGGYTDDFASLASASLLSQVGASERATNQFNQLDNRLNLLTGQVVGVLGQSPPTKIIRFDVDDEWRFSPDVRAISVHAVGGGGGGAGGVAGANGGGGGGGANYSFGFISGEYLPQSITVTVGVGGAGGAPGANGANGTSSSFGPYVAARGGLGGLAKGTGNKILAK